MYEMFPKFKEMKCKNMQKVILNMIHHKLIENLVIILFAFSILAINHFSEVKIRI